MNRFASTYLIAQKAARALSGKLIGLSRCVCHRSASKAKKGISASLALILVIGLAPLIASAHELEKQPLTSAQGQPASPSSQPSSPQDQPVSPKDDPVSPKDQSTSSQYQINSLQDQPDSLQAQDVPVGQTFKGTITIGGVARDCRYKVIGDGTAVQVGDGVGVAIDTAIPGDIAIPNATVYQGKTYTVAALGAHAFSDCEEITSTGLESNSSVTSIGASVFSGCTKLVTTGLASNSSVAAIPGLAFSNCTSLASTGLGSNSTVGTIDGGSFNGCTSLRSTGLESNSTVTMIGASAFSKCAALSGDLVLSSSVRSIGASAFGQTGYTRAYLLAAPDRVKVGNLAFYFTGGYSTLYVAASWVGTSSLQTDDHTYSTSDGSLVVMTGQSLSAVSAARLSPSTASASFTPSISGSAKILAEDKSVLWSGKVSAGIPVSARLKVDAASHKFQISSPGPVYPANAIPTSYNVGPTANAEVSLAAHSYTVSFDGNGADGGSILGQTMAWDVPTALSGNAYSRSGYLFAGWNTQADGSGIAYSDGQMVSQLTLDPSIVLYAQWAVEPVTPPVGPSPSDTPGAPDVSGASGSGLGSDSGALGGSGAQVLTADNSLPLVILLSALAAAPVGAIGLRLLKSKLAKKSRGLFGNAD